MILRVYNQQFLAAFAKNNRKYTNYNFIRCCNHNRKIIFSLRYGYRSE